MLIENPTVSITVAVIGLVGTVVGVLLKMFSDELKNILTGRRKGSGAFVGKWNCAWVYKYPIEKKYNDTVEITKALGDKLFATGSNGSVTYEMIGSIKNDDIILISYSGEKLKNALGGVVILIADKKRKSMQGRWDEYTNDGNFRGGTTTWEKEK